MPIAINGSGTITGVSVGGLPDGIVDTDMIAAAAVTAPKRGPSAILQIVQNVTNSRLQTSSTTYVASDHTVTITPVAANSKILINFFGCANSNGTNHRLNVDVYRSINGGTFTGIAPQGSSGTTGGSTGAGWVNSIRADNSRIQVPLTINFLDDPSYTLGNSIVYTLYARAALGNVVEMPASNQQEPFINIATEISST